MVLINGEDFQIYDLDTDISILNRIASRLNTLPKYLYFPDGVPAIEQFKTNENIIVEDVLTQIQNYDNTTFTPLYKDFKNKILLSNLKFDLIDPFIAYNQELKEQFRTGAETFNIWLEAIQREIESLNLTQNLSIQDIWTNRIQIRASFSSEIENNKRKSNEQLEYFQRIEGATELGYTSFELEKDRNELTLDLNNITLMEVFNYIKLNPNIPFASLDNFYKILKDFIPYEEWSLTTEDIIIMVSPTINPLSNPKITDYSTMIIQETEVEEQKKMVVHFYYNKSVNNLDKDQLIERIMNVFPRLEPLRIKNLNSDSINGVFYFPRHILNKHVLSDLIMNDPLFSTMLSVNEGTKATTSRNSIYVYFNHLNTGPITATITEKVMTRIDPTMKDKDSRQFPRGKKYVRVKIKNSRSMEAIQEFQIILSKLMTLYDEEYPRIVQIYREYIPDFGVNDFVEEEEEEEEENIFPSGFSRRCGTKKMPTVITSLEQEREAIQAGKDIMIFPRDLDAHLASQRKYICNYEKDKYPGLKENIDPDTKDRFPLLPCCYAKDPKNPKFKSHAKYRVYYGLEEEKEKTQVGIQQNLIKTNKFVNFKIFGFLPRNINRMFGLVDTDKKYSYLRTGVFDTKSSFLNCVLLAIGDKTVQSLTETEEIEVFLAEFRNSAELLSPELAAACKQEMYDYTTDEILTIIQDPTIYFDPKLFIHLLEVKYNCNIFLFSRDETNNDKMILPRHIQSYQKIKNNNPCIFIYEHIGSESDQATYPRCELIVKFNNLDSTDITYRFESDDKIYRKINQVYNNLRESYSLNRINEENDFPLVGTYQKIDSYGKVRMLNIEYSGNLISLITSPMQPSAIPETMEETISKIDAGIATRFAASKRMLITGQTVIDGVLKEIFATIGNVRVSIPVFDSVPLPVIPKFTRSLNYLENNLSVVQTYNRNKKLARYIVEYMFWFYSKFLRYNRETELVPERMVAFANQYFIIDPLFEYGNVPKTFSETSGVMSNGKLVLRSQETLKRLLYVLRLEAIRNPKKLLTYYQRETIENFYIDITDFDQYQSQVILQGEDSLEKWSKERKVNYKLHNDILLGDSPYFFKNKKVGGNNLFLAQNTDSIEKAISIAQTWYENGYNPTNTVTEAGLVEFTLYAFGGSDNIKSYSVQGLNYPQNIKILGYNINDESLFTVLLPV